jgi:type IV secretion system protein VirD4
MTNRQKAKRLAIGLAATLLGATALSSVATQDIAARLDHHPALGQPLVDGFYQPFAWLGWQQEAWAADAPRAFLPTRLGLMAIVVLGGGLVLLTVQRKSNQPQKYDTVHGTAKFATEAQIRNAGLLDAPEGVYIGAWQDKAGRVHYIRHDGAEHVIAIAPTRSGKGVGLVIPTLLSWPASTVVLDEKAELWPLTAGWRKSIGQTVLRWQPGSPDCSASFNFLSEVRLGTGYEVADAQNIAVMMIDPEGKGFKDHWDRTAFGLLTGVILHVAYEAQTQGREASLPDVALALSDPDRPADALYAAMAENRHHNGARHMTVACAGTDQLNRPEKERGSVLSSCVTYMQLFTDPIVAGNSRRSDFKIRDLMNADKPVSLYILLPGSDKVRLRPLARLMMTMITRGAVDAPITFDSNGHPVAPHRHRMLMMFDEFPTFGKLAVFEDALAKLAGYGVKAYLITQDREQLIGAYGQNETILSNCGVQVVYAPNKVETADWISRLTGTSTVTMDVVSESGKRGSNLNQVNHSYSSTSRPLLTPDEVRSLRGATKNGDDIIEAGELLVFASKLKIKGRQILYFEDRVFAARAAIPPPAQSDIIIRIASFRVVA